MIGRTRVQSGTVPESSHLWSKAAYLEALDAEG